LKQATDKKLLDKLIPGNEILIEGPWNVTRNQDKQGQETFVNVDNIKVYENEERTKNVEKNEEKTPKNILLESCNCDAIESAKRTCLSRSNMKH